MNVEEGGKAFSAGFMTGVLAMLCLFASTAETRKENILKDHKNGKSNQVNRVRGWEKGNPNVLFGAIDEGWNDPPKEREGRVSGGSPQTN